MLFSFLLALIQRVLLLDRRPLFLSFHVWCSSMERLINAPAIAALVSTAAPLLGAVRASTASAICSDPVVGAVLTDVLMLLILL